MDLNFGVTLIDPVYKKNKSMERKNAGFLTDEWLYENVEFFG